MLVRPQSPTPQSQSRVINVEDIPLQPSTSVAQRAELDAFFGPMSSSSSDEENNV